MILPLLTKPIPTEVKPSECLTKEKQWGKNSKKSDEEQWNFSTQKLEILPLMPEL